MSRGPAGQSTLGGESADLVRPARSTARPRAVPTYRPGAAAPLPEGVLRPRLLHRLDRVLDARLGSVVAPAGAGKTTLMAQWARRAPVDVAWYRAESGDATPEAVLRRLGHAVEQVTAHRLVGSRLDSLLAHLAAHESPLVVVIDDLHLVARPAVADVLQQLLVGMPAHVHVLTGSRTAPPFNLARMEVPTVVVGPADLRFRSPETDRLFRTTYGVPLSPADCQRLTRRTEGWAAALHLFQLQVAGLPPDERHRAVAGLDGPVRYAREYLGREILADLPRELVHLLRRTSVLETLTGRRCDLLLGTTHSQHALLELERRGVVTASLGGSGSFRLPSVLRDHLVTQLRDELGEAGAGDWLRRAARVAIEDPGPDGAAEVVRLHAAAADWPDVVAVLEGQGAEVLRSVDLEWVESVPPHVRRRETWLRLADATRAVRDGRLGAAAELARLPAEGTPPAAVALGAALQRFARLWAVGDLAPGDQWFEQLRAELRRPRAGAGALAGSPGHALLRAIGLALSGDVRAARQRLDAGRASLHDDPLLSLAGELVAELLTPGDADSADALADRAESQGMPWFARLAHGLATSLDAAQDASLARQIADAEARGDQWGAALLAAIQCLARLRAGHPDPAEYDDLVARCHALDAPALEAWARAGLALAAAAANLPDAVREGRSAEGYARCAAVPGAVAVSYGALSVSGPEEYAELRGLAEAEAEAAGLDCRPWTWIGPADEPAPRVRLGVSDDPPLTIRCLGRFELRVGDETPVLTRVRPKARAVLRLLALHAGRPAHREMLVDALWPDLDSVAGTHNLQVCISSLRSLLEPGVPRGRSRLLVRDGDRYTLRLPPHSSCDLQAFDLATREAERARLAGDLPTAVARLDAAVRTYTGDVLPDDGPAEWAIGPREHYRVRAAEAAASLAELLLCRAQPDRAAAAALRSIEIDPCRDGSWRLLVAAYQASGDVAAAERSRRSYAEVLASLGLVSEQAQAVLPPRPAAG